MSRIQGENNQLGILAPKKNPLTTDLVKPFCATGTCTDEQVKQLVQTQNQINEAGGKSAVAAAGVAAIVAAVPALAVLGPEALANAGNKYLYDPTTSSFPDTPNSVNKLLSDPGFNAAAQKGFYKYRGGN